MTDLTRRQALFLAAGLPLAGAVTRARAATPQKITVARSSALIWTDEPGSPRSRSLAPPRF